MSKIIQRKNTSIDGINYEMSVCDTIQEFKCDRCGKVKKSKRIVHYEKEGKQKRICNGCYGNICSVEKTRSINKTQELPVALEENIWGCIVYQCITHYVNIGKLWPKLHFKVYNGVRKGKPILDAETYNVITNATGCKGKDLILSKNQLRERMTELLISLLANGTWFKSAQSEDNESLTLNINGDRMSLCYGAYKEGDDVFLVNYIPTQTREEPKITTSIFEGLFYIRNKNLRELFFEKLDKKPHNKKIIYDPMEKFKIGGNKEVSLIELFLMDFELFSRIKKGQFENVVLAPEICKFFDKCHPLSKSSPFNVRHKSMQDKWEKFNRSRKNRMIRELNEKLRKEHAEQNLFNATIHDEIQWVELQNTHSQTTINRRYECSFDGLRWQFDVVGFKKDYDNWRAHFELVWRNSFNDSSRFGGELYAELYKELQQRIVHKDKAVSNPHIKQMKPGEKKKEIGIGNNDFLVRTNLFRCYHKNHLVEEIIGLAKVVTPGGEIITKKVPCAYCPECQCFYMLQSQFKKLNESGIVLCHLIEKEEYYKSGKLGDFNVASESLLMRNGYNVKANNGLTDIQRQIILKNIIDNNILTPHRISSYLDMFIAQKRNLPQYQEAVLKWEKDKQFVLAYKNRDKEVMEVHLIKDVTKKTLIQSQKKNKY